MKLRITLPDQDPVEVEVSGDRATLGRAADCDVVVPSPYVSKVHLELLRGLVVHDRGSSNGTFLGSGERVFGAGLMPDGQLSIGPDIVHIEVVEEEPEQSRELRDLQAVRAGLEQDLEDLRNENSYLRLQVESLRKADATRAAVEELSKADLEKQGKDFDLEEFERLQSVYAKVLEKLQSDIDTRMKERNATF